MARPLRNVGPGRTHHTFSRCHGKRNLLHKHAEKYFLESIRECQEKYDFQLIAARIIDNTIHLVVKTKKGKATISRIMQYIKARMAEKYNRATGETGPFWNQRFGSAVIDKGENPLESLS